MRLWHLIFVIACVGLVMPAGAASVQELSNEITELVRKASPSVVEIQSGQKLQIKNSALSKAAGKNSDEKVTIAVRKRVGSGFVIDSGGYILTTGNVVDGSNSIRVKFADGSVSEGKLMGVDPLTDIAVIKIDRAGLQPLELGDSSSVGPGTIVVTINNQSGMINSASLGMISGVGRQMGLSASDLIQVSGTIGPGASGGPVLDCTGKVVGVTIAMLSSSTTIAWANIPESVKAKLIEHESAVRELLNQFGFRMRSSGDVMADTENLINEMANVSGSSGFAIPINKVKSVINDLKSGKVVRRSWLGVVLTDRDGEFVLEPAQGGPAEAAGIKPGDVLVKADGKVFRSLGEFSDHITSRTPGDVMVLTVGREGKLMDFRVTLGERKSNRVQMVNAPKAVSSSPAAKTTVYTNAFTSGTGLGAVAAARSGDQITLDVRNSTVSEIAKTLSSIVAKKITVADSAKLNKRITIRVEQASLKQVLDKICQVAGCVYKLDGDGYVISLK